MDLNCTSNGTLEREARRKRIILSQSQKDTLCAWFEKNPYPDIATRGHLAKEIGISESQILTWFQKHRTRQKHLEFECSIEEYQTQGQDKTQFRAQAKEARRTRTHFTRSQTSILIQAFDKNRFPGIATREELAKQMGLPESRIHIWFQNRRSRHPGQSRGRPVHSLSEGPSRSPPRTVQLPLNNQHTAANSSGHLSPSKAFTSTWSLAPALSPPHTAFGPWDASGACESQLPRATTAQPSQAVQGRENSHTSSTLTGHLSTVMTLGVDCSRTQAPFRPSIQGRCLDLSEHTGLAILSLKHCIQSPPANPQLQDLGQKDTPFFLQCWDEWFQSILAEWEPEKGPGSPGRTEIYPWQVQGQPHENPSHLCD